MSQTMLLTAHPDADLEASEWDEGLDSIEDFAEDRYGISDNPYAEAPAVHPDFTENYRERDGEAFNALAVDHRSDNDSVINMLLNRTSAEYVTKVQSSDHEWDANAWVYQRDGSGLESDSFFGEPDEEGRDVRRKVRREFDIEPHIPFF